MLSYKIGERGERESLKMKKSWRVGLGETGDTRAYSSCLFHDAEMLL